ncbi:peptidase M10 [Lentilactobacillus parakefiri]|uniref:M57 family metalloprotease n=1 Tax=Lentilactobacillus parakefiri TaxID=152332 RepID=UPI000BA617AB|nr:M57 family metalloprotease [Lentilactobacillus parakefiri]PAL01077.1 peptidase M10 [Lentilactobacillus parakefiri]
MKKRNLLLVALASVLFALAAPLTIDTASSPITYAKSTKKVTGHTVAKAIKSTPDLNPTASVRKFPTSVYDKYWQTFDCWYNVEAMSRPGTFKNHTASIYISNKTLRPYAAAAIQNWNQALNTKVFKLGTQASHTITVNFKHAGTGTGSWDGYYISNRVYLNYNFFDNSAYLPAVYKAETGQAMPDGNKPESSDYQALYVKYWESVITHELGHSLGLDHTPYSNDIMESDSETKGSDFKYSWSRPIIVNNNFAIFQNKLSSRDINRAHLTKILGYW